MDDNYGLTFNGGILQITYLVHITSSSSNSLQMNGGTLDIDGGEVRVGDMTDYDSEFNVTSNGGILDVSGGLLKLHLT